MEIAGGGWLAGRLESLEG